MNVQIKVQSLSAVMEVYIWNVLIFRDPSSVNVIMDILLILTEFAKVGSL